MSKHKTERPPAELIPILEEQVNQLQAKIARLKAEMCQDSSTRTEGRRYNIVTIEFDGGTSCNLPAKGYDEGYGSFQIGDQEVQRVKFGKGHSSNSAEIRTLTAGLEALAAQPEVDPAQIQVLARGDSKIALKWVECRQQPKEKTSEGFREAIAILRVQVSRFAKVKTQWRGREHSVKLFGH